MNQQQVNQMKGACEKSLSFLCTEVLWANNPRDKSYWDECHDDVVRFIEAPGSRKLVLMPRGHLKSSVITIGWTIQQLLRNPDLRVLIANATWDNARTFLSQIKDYLTGMSILPALYGPFESNVWTQDFIKINQRRMSLKEPTISTTGLEKTQTSQHYDIIILDDLVARENVGTSEQITKVIKFYGDILDLLEPNGKLIVIGTRWAIGDLYEHIIENEARSINLKPLKTHEDRKKWRDLVPA